MRILYWTERFWPHIGGIEVLSNHLIPALAKRGHHFCIVTSHSARKLLDEEPYTVQPAHTNGPVTHKENLDTEKSDKEKIDEIVIHRFHFLTSLTNRNLPQMIAARKRLARLKESFRPDLVHIHFSGPSSLFHWQTQSVPPIPTLVTFHSVPTRVSTQSQEANSLLVKTLHNATWINTVSAFMLRDMQRIAPEIEPRSSVIYNGIAHPNIEQTALPFNPPVLLCLGRLVGWKGFDLALRAFATLLPVHPTARLVIAGDGPARSELEQLAATLNIARAVEFTGWITPEAVPALLNRATLVLIPSQADENLPVVAIQSGQIARPLVAARLSGLPEIVTDGVTGLLLDSHEPQEWVDAICQLLATPERTSAMGKAARQIVAERFDLERCATAYDQLYRQLAAAHPIRATAATNTRTQGNIQ